MSTPTATKYNLKFETFPLLRQTEHLSIGFAPPISQQPPWLIHGDLWEGNIGTEFETGETYIFDAGAYYAHNEMEIGMWRRQRHKIRSEAYKRAYLQNSTVSDPADEWDGRNRIYCVKMNKIHSAHHAGDVVRQT